MIGMGGVTKSMEAGPPLFIYADSPAIAPHPGDTCPGTPALWPNTRQVHESAPSFVLSLSPCQMQVRYLYRARAPLLRAASLTFHRGQDARVQTTPFDLRFLPAAVLALSACSGHENENVTTSEQDLSTAQVPAGTIVSARVGRDSIIAQEGLPHGRWRFEGRIPLAEPGAENELVSEPMPVDERDNENLETVDPAGERMAITYPNGDVYSVEFSAEELAVISAVLENRGFAEESFGDDEASMVPKNWVNGTDNRLRRGVADTTGSNESRVGRLSNGCTATFVGGGTTPPRYFIITASHCLFTAPSGAAVFPNFVPRQDPCVDSQGNPISPCNTQPFGSWWQNGGRIHYQAWLDSCRGLADFDSFCAARDIALAEVSRPSGVNFPGAHGFGVWATNSTPTLIHRGYPGCWNGSNPRAPDAPGGSVSTPNVCSFGTSYGRSTGSWGSPFQGGLGMNMAFSTSGGHSGGPYWVNSGGAKVTAVHSQQSSTSCFPTGTTNCARPSRGPRITDTFYGWMLSFMGL